MRPFRTSFGTSTEKICILARVRTDHAEGWGECVADDGYPGFSGEWIEGAWALLRDVLGPALLRRRRPGGRRASKRRSRSSGGTRWRRRRWWTRSSTPRCGSAGCSLASWLGAERDHVACGVSVGITDTTEELRAQVDGYLDEGYRRIKLKIAPGIDVERVGAIRAAHPDIRLSVDANAAYTLEDAGVFRALDAYELLMIEQPLHHEDLVMHAALQHRIVTSLCLDESIRSAADAAAAIELGACRIVNIKQGRVGGVLEARRVHDVCRAADVPVWCGGMLETGVGRALEPGAGLAPRVHAAGGHERLAPLLPRGPDGAVRARARRHDGGAPRSRDRRGPRPRAARRLDDRPASTSWRKSDKNPSVGLTRR